MGRLQQALGIRLGEETTVARILSMMVLAWGGAAMGSSAAESLFLVRFGPRNLPYMYMAVGIVTLPVMLAISAILARRGGRRVFVTILLALSVCAMGLRAILLLDQRWAYPTLWLGMMVIWTALGTVTWGIAGSVHDTRQAKRLFPLYGAGAIVGGAIGGLLTPVAARLLHSENLLLLWAASLAGTAIIATSIVGRRSSRSTRLPGPRARPIGLLDSVLQGARYVRHSPLALWMSIAIVLLNMLYFSLTLPFAKAATARFTDADDLSAFLGLFTGVTNAAALVLSIALAKRLFARFGVPNSVLALPVIYLVGFAVLIVTPGFVALVAIRSVQWIWLNGVWASGWQALRGVVPPDRRQQFASFLDGGPMQLGVLLAGGFLLVSQQTLSARGFFLTAAVLAAVAVVATWRLRRTYGTALVDALRSGWPEVFLTEGSIGDLPLTPDVRATLIDGTRDPEPGVRRLALETLTTLAQGDNEEIAREALEDADPGVRLAALLALQQARSPDPLDVAFRLLDDDDARVRSAAVDAVVRGAQDGTDVAPRLRRLLIDPDVIVRLHAAAALIRSSNDPQAAAVLETSTRSDKPEDRAETMAALAEVGARADLVTAGLDDEHANVRIAAARALRAFGSEVAVEPLLAALDDDDAGVREALADALVTFDGDVTSRLLSALGESGSEDTALRALVRIPDADPSRLRSYAERERERALGYHRSWALFASHDDPRVRMLAAALRFRALQHAEHAVRALIPSDEHEAAGLALPDLASRDPNQRAIAIETLDALSDRDVVRPLLEIWEPQALPRAVEAEALVSLMREEDAWVRACAAYAADAFGDEEVTRLVAHLAQNDLDATVRTSVGLGARGERSMKASIMSLMDRVLALGQVPLFRELTPADLKHVADAVTENSYLDGTVIVEEGDPADAMHVVVAGEISVQMRDQGLSEIARRGPGYIVGEMAILGDQSRMANLVAVGDVKTLSIDRARFQRILRERPDAALAVMRELCARLAAAHAARAT